jgi:hypothetical protein
VVEKDSLIKSLSENYSITEDTITSILEDVKKVYGQEIEDGYFVIIDDLLKAQLKELK